MLPKDYQARKALPMYDFLTGYFPDAIVEIVKVAVAGNVQHNPGEPLHWAREKSSDHEDCVIRHMLNPYNKDEDNELHIVHAAWRALAAAELALERLDNHPAPNVGPGG